MSIFYPWHPLNKNEVNILYFQSELSDFAISKFSFKNNNLFYLLLLLTWSNIILNPGPFSNPQLFRKKEWKGLHLFHLNINSLLPKIDKLNQKTKAAVIGISESKFNGTVIDPKIYIGNCKILRFDRNQQEGGVAC